MQSDARAAAKAGSAGVADEDLTGSQKGLTPSERSSCDPTMSVSHASYPLLSPGFNGGVTTAHFGWTVISGLDAFSLQNSRDANLAAARSHVAITTDVAGNIHEPDEPTGHAVGATVVARRQVTITVDLLWKNRGPVFQQKSMGMNATGASAPARARPLLVNLHTLQTRRLQTSRAE